MFRFVTQKANSRVMVIWNIKTMHMMIFTINKNDPFSEQNSHTNRIYNGVHFGIL